MSRKDHIDSDVSATGDALRDVQAGIDGEQAPKEVLEIRGNIEQTRAQMSETIEELQQRLSPSHIKEQVREQVVEHYMQAKQTVREATIGKVEDMVERVSDTVYEARRGVVDTITANPIPSALVGIGLAWLLMNRRSGDSGGRRSAERYRDDPYFDEGSGRYGGERSSRVGRQRGEAWDGEAQRESLASRASDAVSGVAGQVQSAVSGVAGQVQSAASDLALKTREKVGGVVDQARQTSGQLANRAQYQARRVEERFSVAMQENPLAVGAVALAVGTAIGLAVPQTRKENEWMGEARDTLVDKAQAVANEAKERVQQVAQQAAQGGPAVGGPV